MRSRPIVLYLMILLLFISVQVPSFGRVDDGLLFTTQEREILSSKTDNLLVSTYFGGSDFDTGRCVEVSPLGEIYFAGTTYSDDLPLVNPFTETNFGDQECFLVKLDPNGTSIEWSGYFGGSNFDALSDMAVDESGNVYLTGFTFSDDFPLVNANDSHSDGGQEAFIMKFSSTGLLLFSTFYGSDGVTELGVSITLDSSGSPFVLIETVGDLLQVVKVSTTGDSVEEIASFGGSGYNSGTGIEITANDDIYVVGSAGSSDFPLVNSYDDVFEGYSEGFVVRLNSSGYILASTFLGGEGSDDCFDIEIFNNTDVFVIGGTDSLLFPDTVNSSSPLVVNCFVTQFNLELSTIEFSGQFGGSLVNIAQKLIIDNRGFPLITGATLSEDFPIVHSRTEYQGDFDVFIAKINPFCLDYSGFLMSSELIGGASYEWAYDIAYDLDGCPVIVGETDSYDFPMVAAIDDIPFEIESFLVKSSLNFMDLDEDLMDDNWEISNGLNPLIVDSSLDPDLDDLLNLGEYEHGTDPQNNDSDFDLMTDGWEVFYGLDPLFDDSGLDIDNDNLTNYEEFTYGFSPLTRDTDYDLMDDMWELLHGLNPWKMDSTNDSDLDGLINYLEYRYGCDPWNIDSDFDLMDDFYEVSNYLIPTLNDSMLDKDGDTLSNLLECQIGTSASHEDTDRDTMDDAWEYWNNLNPLSDTDAYEDPDDDGLMNVEEYLHNTSPHLKDTDYDSMSDFWEVWYNLDPLYDDSLEDADSDMVTNIDEYLHGSSPNSADSDSDSLDDYSEIFIYGSSPSNPDSDLDSMPDYWEILYGLNATDDDAFADLDGDFLTNQQEFLIGTMPNNTDSDSDFYSDYWEYYNGFDPNDPTVQFAEVALFISPYLIVLAIMPFVVLLGLRYKGRQKFKEVVDSEENKKKEALASLLLDNDEE